MGTVQILAIPTPVEVNGHLQVIVAGLDSGQQVSIVVDLGGGDEIVLDAGAANESGAYLMDTRDVLPGGLPDGLVSGAYTMVARTDEGPVASVPLVVVQKKVS